MSINGSQNTLKIGTRDSALAMKQTNHVKATLLALHPNLNCTVDSMKTVGDKKLDVELSKIGSKALFTKELEDALNLKQVHIVVHSLKDLPTQLPPGMVIGAILEREDPRDAVILHPKHKGKTLDQLPEGSILGSSSVRRVAQLTRNYPQLKYESVRGNLNTRLRKLEEADKYSGLVLAAAGIHRLGWKPKVDQYLNCEDCLHAVGQGAIAVECLENDSYTQCLLHAMCHADTLLAVIAERTLMAKLEGGCSAPVAASCQVNGDIITIKAGVWSLDGKVEILEEMTKTFSLDNNHSNQVEMKDNSKESLNSMYNIGKLATIGDPTKCPVLQKMTEKQSTSFSGAIQGCPVLKGIVSHLTKNAAAAVSHGMPDSHMEMIQNSINGNTGATNGRKRSASSENDYVNAKRNKLSEDGVQSFAGIVPPSHLKSKAVTAEMLGVAIADALLKRGAAKVLAEAKALNTMEAPNTKPTTKQS